MKKIKNKEDRLLKTLRSIAIVYGWLGAATFLIMLWAGETEVWFLLGFAFNVIVTLMYLHKLNNWRFLVGLLSALTLMVAIININFAYLFDIIGYGIIFYIVMYDPTNTR